MLTILTPPVSRSISTTQQYAPEGKLKFGTCWNTVESSPPGSMPPGSSSGWKLFHATSLHGTLRAGVPFTKNFSSSMTMSSALASNKCAAIRFAFSYTRPLAVFTPSPPTATAREPMVPIPCGTTAVSPCFTLMRSKSIPSSSAAIWA